MERSPGEKLLHGSLLSRNDKLTVVMRLDARLHDISTRTADAQASAQTSAMESAQLWEQLRVDHDPSNSAIGEGTHLKELASLRKALMREKWLEDILGRAMRESVLKSGVDWSQDPELTEAVIGLNTRID